MTTVVISQQVDKGTDEFDSHSTVIVFADVLTSASETDSELSINDGYEIRQQDQLEETSEYRTQLLFSYVVLFR